MKFLNVGALEFVFILLLAFIVLGPEKAIKTAGDVARFIKDFTKSSFWRDLVSTSREIQNLPKTLMEENELQRTYDDLKRTTGEIKSSFAGTGKMIEDELQIDEDAIVEDSDPDTKE